MCPTAHIDLGINLHVSGNTGRTGCSGTKLTQDPREMQGIMLIKLQYYFCWLFCLKLAFPLFLHICQRLSLSLSLFPSHFSRCARHPCTHKPLCVLFCVKDFYSFSCQCSFSFCYSSKDTNECTCICIHKHVHINPSPTISQTHTRT